MSQPTLQPPFQFIVINQYYLHSSNEFNFFIKDKTFHGITYGKDGKQWQNMAKMKRDLPKYAIVVDI
jgi:hypothetical protein